MPTTFKAMIGRAGGSYTGSPVLLVNRFPTEDEDISIFLFADGSLVALPFSEFVQNNGIMPSFAIQSGLTYGAIVMNTERTIAGVICGWNTTTITLLGPVDPHLNHWEVRQILRENLTFLTEDVESAVAKISGVPPFAPPITISAEIPQAMFMKTALIQLRRYERALGEQARASTSHHNLEQEVWDVVTVEKYTDRVTEGQGAASQTFWKVIPAIEDYPAVMETLQQVYQTQDLTFLRRIPSRNEAYRLAREIREAAADLPITIAYRPTKQTPGWNHVGNLVSAYRQWPDYGDGISVKHLSLLCGLPESLVALIDADIIEWVTPTELQLLAHGLGTDSFSLMRNHG